MSQPGVPEADVVIIGAGPVGLFAAFQLGLFGFRCSVVDAMERPGGQCIEYYADKPIYDIPAWPSITGQDLVDRLLEQVSPFSPAIACGTVATSVEQQADGRYTVGTDRGAFAVGSAVILAGGWGVLGRLAPDVAPPSQWGIGFSDDVVPVGPSTFQTARPGVFTIGDMCSYPGKLRLILSGFHEAALATQAIRKHIDPKARSMQQYTSSSSELQRKLGIAGQG